MQTSNKMKLQELSCESKLHNELKYLIEYTNTKENCGMIKFFIKRKVFAARFT